MRRRCKLNFHVKIQQFNKVINYLDNLHLFSASFIQNDGETLSEGLISIGMKRIRVEYLTPSKILIILDDNKAMYYNYELQEDEFFANYQIVYSQSYLISILKEPR